MKQSYSVIHSKRWANFSLTPNSRQSMEKTPDKPQWKVTQQNTQSVLLKVEDQLTREAEKPQEKALVNGILDGKDP